VVPVQAGSPIEFAFAEKKRRDLCHGDGMLSFHGTVKLVLASSNVRTVASPRFLL
jgi:hypothetical protein